jgi:hypothetical protein
MASRSVQLIGASRPPQEFDPEVENQEKSWKKWKLMKCLGSTIAST